MAAAPVLHFSILLLSITILAGAPAGALTVELTRRQNPQSTVTSDNSEYLMKILVGTPAQELFLILDSGSDLFWAQCLPCSSCYKQIKPAFDPYKSSSFREIPCQSEQCRFAGGCSGSCNYSYGYVSGGTQGTLATETVAIAGKTGETTSFENVVFGCGHNNSGTFNENEMGLIGFGRGPASFISQVGPSIGGRKFSYCLPPFNTDPAISTTLSLGAGSEVKGTGVITVQLAQSPDPSIYSTTLTGISVGTTLIPYNSSGPAQTGNVIIDSGTPTTYLPQDFYDRLTAEVKKQTRSSPTADKMCYRPTDGRFTAPAMSMHFDGGVELPLSSDQSFIRMTDGSFCFAMDGYSDPHGVIGNFVQANFLVGYDLDGMTVSFKPMDCTKFG